MGYRKIAQRNPKTVVQKKSKILYSFERIPRGTLIDPKTLIRI